MNLTAAATRVRKDERGAALVEFAFVIPMFFVVVLGTVSVLWFLTVRSTITGAARDGARYASIRHDPLECETTPCPTGYPTAAEVEQYVRERAGDYGVDEVIVVRPDRSNAEVSVTVRRNLPVIVSGIAALFGDEDLVYTSIAKVRAE